MTINMMRIKMEKNVSYREKLAQKLVITYILLDL